MSSELIVVGRTCMTCDRSIDTFGGCPRCGANQRIESSVDGARNVCHRLQGRLGEVLAWVMADVLRVVWILAVIPLLMGPALGAIVVSCHHLARSRPSGMRVTWFVAVCLVAAFNLYFSYQVNVSTYEAIREWAAGLIDLPDGWNRVKPSGARIYRV